MSLVAAWSCFAGCASPAVAPPSLPGSTFGPSAFRQPRIEEQARNAALAQRPEQQPEPPAKLHRAGSTELAGHVFYGIPILQKSFFWDGNGEVDDSGLGARALHYLGDGVALGLGLNAATWWTGGRNVYSGELEGVLRIYPLDGVPVFVDGTTGFQLANDQIPPGGTVWNFSFGFGFGAEHQVTSSTALQAGAFYHHISNALGRQSPRNPSQNEARIWLGFVTRL